MSASEPTGDAAVDSLVALAGETAQLPVGEHKALYSRVIEGLERELDADPAAAVNAAAAAVGTAGNPNAPQNPVSS
ncbi:hypothetical protein [Specibacter sp. NPDC078709]|uniref:hypothetical protein n=1 Tax=unclassified Specibacter TaxID=3081321 RepID=UPI003420D0C2